MTANTLTPRFKNPFDVNVEQAVGIGGGRSRQSINDKQKMLRKVRIDGEWLIKIKAGNKIQNKAATYEINYKLLVPLSLAVPTFDRQSSRKIDGTLDGVLDDPLDGSLSSLRSDQKRLDKIPPTPQNGKFTKEQANYLGIEINKTIYTGCYVVWDQYQLKLIQDMVNTHGKEAFIAKVRESKAKQVGYTEALEWVKTTLSQ